MVVILKIEIFRPCLLLKCEEQLHYCGLSILIHMYFFACLKMMFELIVLTAIFVLCCCRLSGVQIFMDFGMCWKDSCLHCFLYLNLLKLMKLVKILLSQCSCSQRQSESLYFCLSQKDWGRLPILSGVLLALLDLPKLLIVKLFVSFRSFECFHLVPSWEVAKQWLDH